MYDKRRRRRRRMRSAREEARRRDGAVLLMPKARPAGPRHTRVVTKLRHPRTRGHVAIRLAVARFRVQVLSVEWPPVDTAVDTLH